MTKKYVYFVSYCIFNISPDKTAMNLFGRGEYKTDAPISNIIQINEIEKEISKSTNKDIPLIDVISFGLLREEESE